MDFYFICFSRIFQHFFKRKKWNDVFLLIVRYFQRLYTILNPCIRVKRLQVFFHLRTVYKVIRIIFAVARFPKLFTRLVIRIEKYKIRIEKWQNNFSLSFHIRHGLLFFFFFLLLLFHWTFISKYTGVYTVSQLYRVYDWKQCE